MRRPVYNFLYRGNAALLPKPRGFSNQLELSAPRRLHLSTSRSLCEDQERDQDHHDELLYPVNPSVHHSDLPSFLAYARRTNLDPSSTVYVGTHYEYTVASTLSQYGLFARRVGGASDYGIDLLGTWSIPCSTSSSSFSALSPAQSQTVKSQSATRSLKVILQCKGGAQRITPSLIRELEGSFVGAPPGWRGSGVLALLVGEKTATKGVRESLGRSAWPMGFVSCTKEGVVRQMLWNRKAEEEGLEAIGVGLRYPGHGEDRGEPTVVLTCQGRHMPLLDPVS